MRNSTYPERDYGFGQLVLALRTESNLTQSGLAERLGVSRQAIVGWEAGTSYPSPEHLKQLIELGVQLQAFHHEQEAEEIRSLWQSAHPRLPLDETWLIHLLESPTATSPTVSFPAQYPAPSKLGSQVDWGDAPIVSNFYGRESELALLTDWLLIEHCRLVSLLGIGGIGKTSLAARLVQLVSPNFERVYWRSLRDTPPRREWLSGAIGFLSDHHQALPAVESEGLAVLLQLLRKRRCLLVLDNFDALFEPGQEEERYRAGLEGYSRLLQAIGETSHQSCLLLTSREAPEELAIFGGEAVRAFPLGGLEVEAARLMLAAKQLAGSSEQWGELINWLGGNCLALKLVGETIRELFGGDLGLFLQEAGTSSVFGGIRHLLAEQVGRSSTPEQKVLRALAVRRERVRLADLLGDLSPRLGRGVVLEAVEALRRRSLVERVEMGGMAAFTLQPVVMEYVTEILIGVVAEEIEGGQPVLLVEQALVEAQAKDYVRQSQERLIGVPILERLKAQRGQNGTEQELLALLEGWRNRLSKEQGYGPGNVVNLLRLLRGDLHGLDLSCLALRQAYLAEVDAQDASLAGSHLAETVLAEAFGFPVTVALSSDGALLATGTSTGQVWLWRVADRTLVATLEANTGQVFAVALSADGQMLASGGADGIVRLWETSTRRLLATLEGHAAAISVIALSADGHLLASGSFDETVRLWETDTMNLLATLLGHTGGVWGVALSTDGHLLASGSADGTVRLWETESNHLLATLHGHTSAVWGVALSANGRLAASGGLDGIIRLWETESGRELSTFQCHNGGVWNLALSNDGKLLASCGADGTVRLWEVPSKSPLAALQGHSGGVRGVALSASGHLVASGGLDGTVRLWDAYGGRPLATLQGHTGAIWRVALSDARDLVASSGGDGIVRLWERSSGRLLTAIKRHTAEIRVVALSTDGQMLATGGLDGTVRLWEPGSGHLLATLEGHTSHVWGLALSTNGRLVVSGSLDGTVLLWEAPDGRPLATLQGHTGAVRNVTLSADGRLVASASTDGTVRLWEAPSGRPLATLEGHTSAVWGVALSADGRLLASGDLAGIVRLWETESGRPLATLAGHTSPIWGMALSPDGRLVASGGMDETVRLWEAPSGRPLATLVGHTGPVPAVEFSSDGCMVVSGGWDGTVRLWEAPSGVLIRTLLPERRYERLDITGLTGITEAQRGAFLALGAVQKETTFTQTQFSD